MSTYSPAKYGVKMLVHFEEYQDIRIALQREKNLKHWMRAWKVALIEKNNPEWNDLTKTFLDSRVKPENDMVVVEDDMVGQI